MSSDSVQRDPVNRDPVPTDPVTLDPVKRNPASQESAGGLSQEATELILQRAIEMSDVGTSTGEIELSPQDVAAIATELGVPPAAVAASLAEHQAGVDEKRGLLDRLIGPRSVWARRSSSSSEAQTRERASRWLSSAHGLRPRTRDDGVVVATKRRGMTGAVAVRARKVTGLGGLGSVRKVSVAAVDVDDQPGAVCLLADVSNKRDNAVWGGVGVTAGGMAVVGAAALVAGPEVLLAAPLAAGLGAVATRRMHQSTVRRVTEDVETTIDGIAKGASPPKIIRLPRYRRSSDS